jgi:hypothetical protein
MRRNFGFELELWVVFCRHFSTKCGVSKCVSVFCAVASNNPSASQNVGRRMVLRSAPRRPLGPAPSRQLAVETTPPPPPPPPPPLAPQQQSSNYLWLESKLKSTPARALALTFSGSITLVGLWFTYRELESEKKKEQAAEEEKARNTPEACAERAFSSLRITPVLPVGKRVKRPELEKLILEHANTPGGGMPYLLVVGPRASGKTTVVQHALADRPGVLCISLKDTTTEPVEAQIARQLGLGAGTHSDKFIAAQMKTIAQKKLPDDQPLVVVLEIERTVTPVAINTAVSALKSLSSDYDACSAIAVLSDANAAFSLTSDRARQKFLWVDALTLSEATEFFAQRGKLLTRSTPTQTVTPEEAAANKALIARLAGFFVILDLHAMCKALPANAMATTSDVMDKVNEQITAAQLQAKSAINDLVALGADNTPRPVAYPDLFRALLAACDAEDVHRASLSEEERAKLLPVSQVIGVEQTTVPAFPAVRIIVPHLKLCHALRYHLNTATFHFASEAHRQAAKDWIVAADAKAAAEAKAAADAKGWLGFFKW